MQLTSTLHRPFIDSASPVLQAIFSAIAPQAPQLDDALLQQSTVIIDWSGKREAIESGADPASVDGLFEWVKSHPRRANIHVVLRTDQRAVRTRQLQRSLQSIGCTVIAKTGVGSRQRRPALTQFHREEWR